MQQSFTTDERFALRAHFTMSRQEASMTSYPRNLAKFGCQVYIKDQSRIADHVEDENSPTSRQVEDVMNDRLNMIVQSPTIGKRKPLAEHGQVCAVSSSIGPSRGWIMEGVTSHSRASSLEEPGWDDTQIRSSDTVRSARENRFSMMSTFTRAKGRWRRG